MLLAVYAAGGEAARAAQDGICLSALPLLVDPFLISAIKTGVKELCVFHILLLRIMLVLVQREPWLQQFRKSTSLLEDWAHGIYAYPDNCHWLPKHLQDTRFSC